MNKITIYTTPTCSGCMMAKAYFKEKGLEYTEIPIQESEANLNEAIQVSGGERQAPIIKINESVIVGFNQTKINEVLNYLLNE